MWRWQIPPVTRVAGSVKIPCRRGRGVGLCARASKVGLEGTLWDCVERTAAEVGGGDRERGQKRGQCTRWRLVCGRLFISFLPFYQQLANKELKFSSCSPQPSIFIRFNLLRAPSTPSRHINPPFESPANLSCALYLCLVDQCGPAPRERTN